ncbi:hypothetical protein B0H13DRAFT_2365456 [Mycena leptocephala]|nr:hypothetical protein B0H13DRAFT_2365456 [Mycena leptocephala]
MANPRLTLDPTLESCSVPAGTPLTDAEAATQLMQAWNMEHDTCQVAWDTQVHADAVQAAAGAAALAAQEDTECAAAEAASEAKWLEAEKKKPKLGDFDAALIIPDFLGPCASNFAKKKLDDKQYVELWYWTKEGCLDADSLRAGVKADESFGITQISSTLSLKHLTAFKASKKVVHDEDLTWAQLSISKTGFLAAIEAAGWPKEHRTAVSSFFYAIENHPSRMNHDDYVDIILC